MKDALCKYLLPCGKCDRVPALNIKCKQTLDEADEIGFISVGDYNGALYLLRGYLEDATRSAIPKEDSKRSLLLAIGAVKRERERLFPSDNKLGSCEPPTKDEPIC